MRHAGKTPPFRGPHGEPVPDSIAEAGFVRLGGVEQWVMMRGERVANPPLLVLHGGPGLSEARFFRHHNAELERHFTLVHWDQRGTGKSYDLRLTRASMTVERFLADLGELVDVVRERLGHERVVLFGHSWGSALGVLYAARHPERVAAYVGSGQVGDTAAGEAASYAWALAEAERRGHRRALRALRALGPPPYTVKQLFEERTWVQRLAGQLTPRVAWRVWRVLLGGPEASPLELPRIWRGWRFSLEALWEESSRLNLLELAPALEVPVFFFLGRQDHWVPPEASVAYFDALRAPSKRLVWFERSGHEPFADEPEKFNALMEELVRPLAVAPRRGLRVPAPAAGWEAEVQDGQRA